MGFSNTWDVTQPPDTQPANQGALDFRNLKTDVMQRMGAVCGLKSNIPAIEAGFGSTNLGYQYFASDEGKTYQWNGSAFILVGCNHVFSDESNAVVSLTSGNEMVINQVTIPANYVVSGMLIDVFSGMITAGQTGNVTYRIYFGSTVLVSYTTTGATLYTLSALVNPFGGMSLGWIVAPDGVFRGGVPPQFVFSPSSTTVIKITAQSALNTGNATPTGLLVRASL